MSHMSFLTTNERAAMYERLAARGHAEEARDTRHEITCAMVDLEGALHALKEAGVDVKEAAALLHDMIENRDAALCLTIDRAGEYFEPLDVSGLRSLA